MCYGNLSVSRAYDGLSGISNDLYNTWQEACLKPSGQGLIVKVSEMTLELIALHNKEAIGSCLDSAKIIRGAIAFFDLSDTVSKIAKASYKIYISIYEGCSNFCTDGVDAVRDACLGVSGAVISLSGSVSKLSKSVLDMWTLGALSKVSREVSNDFIVLNQGWGSLVGGLSKLFTSAYCFMYPETLPESFGDVALRGERIRVSVKLGSLHLRVKYAFESISGASIVALGSLSLFFTELATKQNILSLRLVSVSGDVIARFAPRIVARFRSPVIGC